MARVIGEVRPRYAFVENSPILTSRGLGVVLTDLSKMGFDARWGVVSAADVGANHKRERIWIRAEQRHFLPYTMQHGDGWGQQHPKSIEEKVAITNSRCERKGANKELRSEIKISIRQNFTKFCGEMANTSSTRSQGEQRQEQHGSRAGFANESQVVAYTDCERGCLRETNREDAEDVGQSPRGATRPEWWDIEPNVGRVANGMAARVDRLKAIGNGQVPLCAATAWELLR